MKRGISFSIIISIGMHRMILTDLIHLMFVFMAIKSLTIGSNANLLKYFTDKNYRAKYDEWQSNCPK